MNAPRSHRVEINGWVVLDKPVGITSTQAVAQLKHVFNAKKAGHAGTLDPLASGVLPVALGEATKTVPFVQDGEKVYRFTIAWGAETDSDDVDGTVVARSELRPEAAEIRAALPQFTGRILQRPPAFSAIKVGGERAYDLARDGEMPDLAPRPVLIHALALVASDRDAASFEARCGKGCYVRALARDLGRVLGCLGHVAALRRTRVGPFTEKEAVRLAQLSETPDGLLGVEAGLTEMPRVAVDREAAARLRRGQSILLRGREAPMAGQAYASCGGVVVAVGAIEHGELVPGRVFNLPF
ncbi:MAG: tRNA pseudouridine(55) synthase TruB [Methylovirgula sp.]